MFTCCSFRDVNSVISWRRLRAVDALELISTMSSMARASTTPKDERFRVTPYLGGTCTLSVSQSYPTLRPKQRAVASSQVSSYLVFDHCHYYNNHLVHATHTPMTRRKKPALAYRCGSCIYARMGPANA